MAPWMTLSATQRTTRSAILRAIPGIVLWVAKGIAQGVALWSAPGIAHWVAPRVAPWATPGMLQGLPHPRVWRRDSDSRSVGILDCDCVADVASGFAQQQGSRRVLRRGVWPTTHQQEFTPSHYGITPQANPAPRHRWQPSEVIGLEEPVLRSLATEGLGTELAVD